LASGDPLTTAADGPSNVVLGPEHPESQRPHAPAPTLDHLVYSAENRNS